MTKTWKKPGRRKLPSAIRPRHGVYVRLTDAQWAGLKKAAKASKTSTSATAQRCLVSCLKSEGFVES